MARPQLNPWRETVRFSELARGPVERRIAPDGPQLAALAKQLGVDALESLSATVKVSPWLDGAEVRGGFTARVVQTCGVTLEPLENIVSGDFHVRLLPAGSPNLPSEDGEIDLEAEDPPDAVEGDEIDISGYVVEHLALDIDPFPRKPDAVFEPPPAEEEASPFAVLKRLKEQE
ncbi:MAG: YceD family protein [Parcubacteria group bacterium]